MPLVTLRYFFRVEMGAPPLDPTCARGGYLEYEPGAEPEPLPVNCLRLMMLVESHSHLHHITKTVIRIQFGPKKRPL